MMENQLSFSILVTLFFFLLMPAHSFSFIPTQSIEKEIVKDEIRGKKKFKIFEKAIIKYIQKKYTQKDKTLSIGQKALLLGIAAILI